MTELPGSAKAVARQSLGFGLAAFAAALLLCLGVGATRLWPRIAGEHLPFSLIWPFARPLLAVALELAFLLAVPLALALASSTQGKRSADAQTWRETLLSTGLLVVVFGALSFGSSVSLDSDAATPGSIAAELLSGARSSCLESAPPAEVRVPLVGFSWFCDEHRAPRLHGRIPLGKQAEFDASALELSDDLKRASLTHFSLAFDTPLFPVQLHAERATLRGLPPWGRSRRTPFALRAALFVLCSFIAGYGVGRLAARFAWLSVWGAALVGAFVAGASWFAVAWLERQETRPLAYLALPAATIAALALAAAVLYASRRAWLRWAERPTDLGSG
ncbi:MAG TPA: hypothetical protein VGM44_17110 [Polyangiaceae bacterium]